MQRVRVTGNELVNHATQNNADRPSQVHSAAEDTHHQSENRKFTILSSLQVAI